jgi:hypothetical protein
MSEIPVHSRPRRLVDWINPTGVKKVHSLIDKVYQRKNLEMAWEMVKANRGSGGVDGQSLDGFAAQLDQQLDRLQSELKEAPEGVTDWSSDSKAVYVVPDGEQKRPFDGAPVRAMRNRVRDSHRATRCRGRAP